MVSRFKWHSMATIGALVLIHVAIVVIMIMLVMGVQKSILDLDSSAQVRF